MGLGLLIGKDEEVASWVYESFNLYPMPVSLALGVVEEHSEQLIGAIIFQEYNGNNVYLSYYGPNTLTVGVARAIARISIREFDASRVTILTSKRNKRMMRKFERFGFKFEGSQRCFYGKKDCIRNTAARFVMFRDRIEEIAKLEHSDTMVDKRLH